MRSNKGQLIKNKIEYWNCKSVCFCRNWSSCLFGFNNVTFGIPRRFVNLFYFLLFKGLSKLYCMYHKIIFYLAYYFRIYKIHGLTDQKSLTGWPSLSDWQKLIKKTIYLMLRMEVITDPNKLLTLLFLSGNELGFIWGFQ